jgi:DNA polymerase
VSQELLFSEDILRAGVSSFNRLKEMALVCQRCKLCKTRKHTVFGEGCIKSPPIAFIGEAPGAQEDAQGRPFIGRAGQLLDRMIKAMGYEREHVYIGNAVNCRPPENRKPEKEELDACKLFLVGQLRIVQPQIIVALGASAAQALTNRKKGIGDLRGRWMEWEDKQRGKAALGKPIPLRATYHPAYLLRNPGAKSKVWSDLQIVMKWLDRTNKDDGKDKDNGNDTKAD